MYHVPKNDPVIGKYQGLLVFVSELMRQFFTFMYDPTLQASQVTGNLNNLHKSEGNIKEDISIKG
jgi:hypothetical protein